MRKLCGRAICAAELRASRSHGPRTAPDSPGKRSPHIRSLASSRPFQAKKMSAQNGDVDPVEAHEVLQHQQAIIEALWQLAEYFAARIGHQHIIFDSDPEVTIEIDTRLDGNDHAAGQRFVADRRHSWRFMNLQPDAMSEPVLERLIHAGSLQNSSRRPINLVGGNARSDRIDRRQLCLEHCVVGSPKAVADRLRGGASGSYRWRIHRALLPSRSAGWSRRRVWRRSAGSGAAPRTDQLLRSARSCNLRLPETSSWPPAHGQFVVRSKRGSASAAATRKARSATRTA